MRTIDDKYIEVEDNDITWAGDTETEKRLNQELFHTTLQLNWYQDRFQELEELIRQTKSKGEEVIPISALENLID